MEFPAPKSYLKRQINFGAGHAIRSPDSYRSTTRQPPLGAEFPLLSLTQNRAHTCRQPETQCCFSCANFLARMAAAARKKNTVS